MSTEGRKLKKSEKGGRRGGGGGGREELLLDPVIFLRKLSTDRDSIVRPRPFAESLQFTS
jgi:hypothetical protein